MWLALLVVLGIGVWPIISRNAATPDVFFTMLPSVILGSSLNIILGYTGYVSLGHVVFFGFGGYVGLYLMIAQGYSLVPALLAGG